MSFKGFAFKTFFGGKPWYKSLVGWGLVVLTAAETAIPLAGELGLADPEQMSILTSYMEKLAVALAALGIRRRLPATGTIAAVSLVALLSLGCNTLAVTTQIPDQRPVTIKASTFGRSCIAAVVDPKTGDVDIVSKQDGTSDWITGRVLPTLGAMALMGLSGIPFIGDSITIPAPSDIGGCVGIFTDEPDTAVELEE